MDGSTTLVIIPDPKLSRRIQSFYSLFKVIISDPKLLLWIQSSVLLPIQSFFKEL